MLSRVIAKNVGDVFLRHSVHAAATNEILPAINIKILNLLSLLVFNK